MIEKNRKQFELSEERKKEILENGTDIFAIKSRKRVLFTMFLQEYLKQKKKEERELAKKKKKEQEEREKLLLQQTDNTSEKPKDETPKASNEMEIEPEITKKTEETSSTSSTTNSEPQTSEPSSSSSSQSFIQTPEKTQRIAQYISEMEKRVSGLSIKQLEKESKLTEKRIKKITKTLQDRLAFKETQKPTPKL